MLDPFRGERMNKRGQTIKLYIAGDDLKNLKIAELSNWTGKVYIGERKHSKLIQDIDELASPGVYILVSKDFQEFQISLYIGEADEVNRRINDHFRNKDWWNMFIIFVSKDTNLTKSHVRYLEKRFYELAIKKETLIEIKNNSQPTGSKLPISEIDDMEEFMDRIVFILKNLGILNLVSSEIIDHYDEKAGNVFYLQQTKNRINDKKEILTAKLIIVNDGFRLLKGSYIEKEARSSFSRHVYYSLRKKFETEEYIEDSKYKGCYYLKKDIDFTSPSAAASVAKNRATNGPKEWKLKDGTTLDEHQATQQ